MTPQKDIELSSTQPAQRNERVFQEIVVEYPSISAYPEYEGKPYFSIKYTVNGQKFIGYGTYKPEVMSEYLKEYFMPTTQPGWIPCSERLPKENVYVLVWCGEIKIARIIRGISKEQRAKMQEGAINDPVSYGWNLSNGYFKVKRSESYRTCDEYGNNKVPYCWDCIYGEMFGQDVKYWMSLPCRPEGGEEC